MSIYYLLILKRAGERNQIRELSKKIYLPYCSMESNITLEDGYYGDGIISRFPISFSVNYLMPLTDLNHEQRGILCNRISLRNSQNQPIFCSFIYI